MPESTAGQEFTKAAKKISSLALGASAIRLTDEELYHLNKLLSYMYRFFRDYKKELNCFTFYIIFVFLPFSFLLFMSYSLLNSIGNIKQIKYVVSSNFPDITSLVYFMNVTINIFCKHLRDSNGKCFDILSTKRNAMFLFAIFRLKIVDFKNCFNSVVLPSNKDIDCIVSS